MTRTVKSYGIPINEDGSDASQLLIMKEHIFNLTMFDNMITDRTVLDGIVYTDWLRANGKVTDEVFADCLMVFDRMMKNYDHLFYIRPEFAIETDGVRSNSVQWQEEIVKIFDEYIVNYDVKITPLAGSVRERVNTVLKTIGEL